MGYFHSAFLHSITKKQPLYNLGANGAEARQIRKAEGACPGATSIRRAGEKVVLYLLDGLAYDLEPLAPGARQ